MEGGGGKTGAPGSHNRTRGELLPGLRSDRGSSRNAIQIAQTGLRGRKYCHRREACGSIEHPHVGRDSEGLRPQTKSKPSLSTPLPRALQWAGVESQPSPDLKTHRDLTPASSTLMTAPSPLKSGRTDLPSTPLACCLRALVSAVSSVITTFLPGSYMAGLSPLYVSAEMSSLHRNLPRSP